MSVLNLHHAGVHVASLARSIAFYRDLFGLELAERLSFGGEEIAFLAVGSARLELIEGPTSQRLELIEGPTSQRLELIEGPTSQRLEPIEGPAGRLGDGTGPAGQPRRARAASAAAQPTGVTARPTGVVDHFALEVDGLDELAERLRQNGVTLLDPRPIGVPALGARILFCLGPDGERIELFEYQRS